MIIVSIVSRKKKKMIDYITTVSSETVFFFFFSMSSSNNIKYLIINVDDFGYCPKRDKAITESENEPNRIFETSVEPNRTRTG